MKKNKVVSIVFIVIIVLIIGGTVYNSKKRQKNVSKNVIESISTHEGHLVHLRNFEKKSDGFWYFTVSYDQNDYDNLTIVTKTKVFKVSPNIKIITNSSKSCDLTDSANSESFETYKLKLEKNVDYYWNPNNQDPNHYDQVYYMTIDYGVITYMTEVDCTSSGNID